MTSLKK